MKKYEKKLEAALIVVVLLVILPYLNTILYSLPSTDDFWMATGVAKETVFSDALATANWFYLNWGGLWIYEFLRVLLNPIVLFGVPSKWLGIELAVFFLVFIVVLWFFISFMWEKILHEDKKIYPLGTYALVLIWFLNTEVYTEVFYWFVGTPYMWAASLVLVTIMLTFVYYEKPTIWKAILLSVVGFITCSFYSQAVFPGMFYLVCIVLEYFEKKRFSLRKIIPVFFFVSGAMSSLIAPGNFARKGTEGSVSLMRTLIDTTKMWLEGLFEFVKNPLTIVIISAFVLIGLLFVKNNKHEFRYPLVTFLISLVCLYIAYFPFALGYGEAYMPNRATFAFNLFAVLLFSGCALYFGAWLKYQKEIILSSKAVGTYVAYIVAFSYICFIPNSYYEELPYAQTVSQTAQVKAAYDEWTLILRYVDSFEEGEAVVIERVMVEVPIIKWPGITNDETYSTNRNIAKYYGLESIKLEWLWPE